MIWPFKKKPMQVSSPENGTLYFKSPRAFFDYQCKYGHTDVAVGVGVVALVRDAAKELGTPTSVSIKKDGSQLAALWVASSDKPFLVFGSTPSCLGERLVPDDLVLWVPAHYVEEVGSNAGDSRSGWIGLIRAKIKPEINPTISSFVIACRYD